MRCVSTFCKYQLCALGKGYMDGPKFQGKIENMSMLLFTKG